jgi:hypothetical protein
MVKTPKAGLVRRNRGLGRKRARIWAQLGYANLAKARAVHSLNAAKRRAEKERRAFSPYAIEGDVPRQDES